MADLTFSGQRFCANLLRPGVPPSFSVGNSVAGAQLGRHPLDPVAGQNLIAWE